eukprot:TRINITY_DN37874_c0_g1_i1.p1 TRINITY_DN37874_c0_g1~~TRINITY_DN37874_c0_g1_i1.p1  ORF type:complete len:359 (-),score=99.65 TRINITY_DN37874_c0_g1_i1:273-1349(-)
MMLAEAAATNPGGYGGCGADGYDNDFGNDDDLNYDKPRQTNPGSRGHPTACKPCNKYNPARESSCKHGDACEFCHESHERPKHRGQRGRHALQRRMYLEGKDKLSKEETEIIDRIYSIPHQYIEEAKREIIALYPTGSERDEKVFLVLEEIRRIGEEAQQLRPDGNRLRGVVGAHMSTQVCAGIAELDGRCKWLVGTLHLMVRKMQESQDIVTVQEHVNRAFEDCKKLPDLVRHGRTIMDPLNNGTSSVPGDSAQANGQACQQGAPQENETELPGAYPWLHARLRILMRRAEEDEDPLSEILPHVLHICERLPEEKLSEEEKKLFLKSRTIMELREHAQKALDNVLLTLDFGSGEEDE